MKDGIVAVALCVAYTGWLYVLTEAVILLFKMAGIP